MASLFRHVEISFSRADLRGILSVILSAAKDLFCRFARSFAALRMTGLTSKCLPLLSAYHAGPFADNPEMMRQYTYLFLRQAQKMVASNVYLIMAVTGRSAVVMCVSLRSPIS